MKTGMEMAVYCLLDFAAAEASASAAAVAFAAVLLPHASCMPAADLS